MKNPFKIINKKLNRIEDILLSIKNQEQQAIEEPEKLLNVQETAEFLNLSMATIYSKVSRNELPFMKRSKRLYFSSTELIAYLKEGRKKSVYEIEQEASEYLKSR